MSYFPSAIYKDGKLDAGPGRSCRVHDINELMVKAQEGYLPRGCATVKDIINIPELKSLLINEEKKNIAAETTEKVLAEEEKQITAEATEKVLSKEAEKPQITKQVPKRRRARRK